MRGLEPQTPYMRSNKSGSTKACYIRVFGLFSRFLPILLPTENRINNRLRGDLRLFAKVVRDLDIAVLRCADVGVTEDSRITEVKTRHAGATTGRFTLRR
jgi:hypothetical protein